MLGKVEFPIMILAFCYLSVISLTVILGGLFFASCLGISDFVEQQQLSLTTRHCGIYLENGRESAYESCIKKAITYYYKDHR